MSLVHTDNDEFINSLTKLILENLGDENFGVKELAHISGMSPAGLNKRLRSINNKYVNQFIREIRLQKALQLLQNEAYTASEIAYKTGFSSPAYFNKCFHEFYGYPPGKAKGFNGYNQAQNIPVQDIIENNSVKSARKTSLSIIAGVSLLAILLGTVGIFIYNKINKSVRLENPVSSDERISLAIMPFYNMTNDVSWNIWQEGIQTCLITSLSNYEELKVRQIETVNRLLEGKGLSNYGSISPSVAGDISQKIDASVFIVGSINQAGRTIRVNAQIIKSNTEEAIKSFQIDGTSEEILHMIDSLSIMVKNSLIISELEKVGPPAIHERYLRTVKSPEAYRYFIQGQIAFYENDFPTAIDWFSQALEIDSTLLGAIVKISLSYYNDNNYEQGKEWCLRYFKYEDKLNILDKTWANFVFALYFQTPNERLKYIGRLEDIEDQNPLIYFNSGDAYLEIFQYDKAIIEFEKALALFHKWDIKPFWGAFYYELGQAYHKSGQYKKEKKLYRKAEHDFPDDPGLMDQQAYLALTLKDTAAANRYIEKWISIRKEQSWSDASIAGYLAYIYLMADDPDRAVEYFRQALSLEPESPDRMMYLAYVLIDKDRNINEGMELAEKVLKTDPGYFNGLFVKGVGLYKQGKFTEALELLQKSWDLRMQHSIYNHTAFLRLEEAKKAVASQI